MDEPLPDMAPTEKRFVTCKEIKPLEDFNRLRRAKDGRQWNCRACNAAYHAANKERHNRLIHERNRRTRLEYMARIYQYLREHPCTDCGETDIAVLEFDHLRDKRVCISEMFRRGFSWKAIVEEIAKCEVVCANCHRRRTLRRRRSPKLSS